MKKLNTYYKLKKQEFKIINRFNHNLTQEELDKIFEIIEMIYSTNSSDVVIYRNSQQIFDSAIDKLCQMKNKSYFKYVDSFFIHQLFRYYENQYLDYQIIINIIMAMIDYDKYGDLIFYNMSTILWNMSFESGIDQTKTKKCFYVESQLKTALLSIYKSEYHEHHSSLESFIKLYFTYVYMNYEPGEIELLIDGFFKVFNLTYYDHLLLNDVFNDTNYGVEINVKMLFIKEIIDIINERVKTNSYIK